MSAPEGTMKLNAVATQIQYLVVALARRNDVSTHATEATIEANNRWTLKWYIARAICSCTFASAGAAIFITARRTLQRLQVS